MPEVIDAPTGAQDEPVVAWSRWSLPGAWGAVAGACLALTPSLLPRGAVTQGILSGITAAIGYGLGVLLAAIWRDVADRPARTPDARAWRMLAIGGPAAFLVALVLGRLWQQ